MSLWPQFFLCSNPDIPENISVGCDNNSNLAFASSYISTWKFDTLHISRSYSTAKCTELNCASEGCSRSKFPWTNGSINYSGLDNQNPMERKRLYSWQRHNKQKQICSEDRLSTQSKINNNDFIIQDALSKDLCAIVNDEVHPLKLTVDNNSFAMSSGVNDSLNKEPYGVLCYEKPPSSVFDKPSVGHSTSRMQSTCLQVGLANFVDLNVSKFPLLL